MGRKKRGIALSANDIEIVRTALAQERLTQERWSYQAYISISTVKRLLQGKPIDRGPLEQALKVIGLSISDLTIQKRIDNSLPAVDVNNQHLQGLGIFMTATFVDTKRPQIEFAIRHLQTLLVDSKVTFFDSNDGVTVSGVFEEENRKHIEMTIAHLEKLFTSCNITW